MVTVCSRQNGRRCLGYTLLILWEENINTGSTFNHGCSDTLSATTRPVVSARWPEDRRTAPSSTTLRGRFAQTMSRTSVQALQASDAICSSTKHHEAFLLLIALRHGCLSQPQASVLNERRSQDASFQTWTGQCQSRVARPRMPLGLQCVILTER
jgi:hypothetical protein